MAAGGTDRAERMQGGKSSLTATWNAFRHVTLERFPLFLPGVHPIMAPVIMFRLKRRGFSGCRVEILKGGLMVRAER